MVMEVIIPTTSPDFDFNSARPSPRSSAPSTPKRFGDYYFSAPTSPTQISQFYRDFDDFYVEATGRDSPSSIPFGWEEKPGKSPKSKPMHEDDFAFDFSAESEKTTLPAEELFESGKIRPFKPPTPSRLGAAKKVFNPFAASPASSHKRTEKERERGREKSPSLSSTNSGRRAARSQSPHRVSKYPWEDELTKQSSSIVPKPAAPTNPTLTSSYSKSGGSSRKWRLKDFFLFRSASEGRAADKDPLKKYMALFRRHDDGGSVKGSSFRSIEGGSSSGSKRRGPVSAHELHYTVNRAVSEDLKKKTFLPYKQGILGRLAFNPAVHALANGFGFSRK